MKVCYTAIFGNYEELKEPKEVTTGWRYICYTDQSLQSDVWEIKNKAADGMTPQMMARYYKLMGWTEWDQSVWIDASFVINMDLDLWWQLHFRKGFSAPWHPLRNCIYAEGAHCIKVRRGQKGIEAQLQEYKQQGVPQRQGLITSGLLMRENKPEVIALCEAWWQEVEKHSIRDQIAFGRVAGNKNIIHNYRWDYRTSNYFIYKQHYHLR